jgi:hypothetical protein
MPKECQTSKPIFSYLNFGFDLAGKCPDKPRLAGGVKGHNVDDISLPGSAALWAEGFTFELWHLTFQVFGFAQGLEE